MQILSLPASRTGRTTLLPAVLITPTCGAIALGHLAGEFFTRFLRLAHFHPVSPVLPTERIAHLGTAGDCCAAGFWSAMTASGLGCVKTPALATR
jgi:hypothetical protein